MSFLALALSVSLVGCGSGNNKREVSGTISLKGKPLDTGVITFTSADPKGASTGSAQITNGAFKIPKEQGLLPGKYKVSITAPDGKTPDADPNAMPGPSGNFTSKDRIPAKYNINSTLEFEVKDTGENVYTFEVP